MMNWYKLDRWPWTALEAPPAQPVPAPPAVSDSSEKAPGLTSEPASTNSCMSDDWANWDYAPLDPSAPPQAQTWGTYNVQWTETPKVELTKEQMDNIFLFPHQNQTPGTASFPLVGLYTPYLGPPTIPMTASKTNASP